MILKLQYIYIHHYALPAIIFGAIIVLRNQVKTWKIHAEYYFTRITITTKGKYTAINSGALEPLVNILGDERSTEIRVNALKAITCLSEAPEGREWLSQHVTKVVHLYGIAAVFSGTLYIYLGCNAHFYKPHQCSFIIISLFIIRGHSFRN